RAREDVCINGVDVALVVDDPVAPLRALRPAPFSVDEAARLQREPYRNHRAIAAPHVSPPSRFGHVPRKDTPKPGSRRHDIPYGSHHAAGKPFEWPRFAAAR